MSPPLFLVETLPATELLALDGAEGHHAVTVARLNVGESLLLGDGRGALAEAVVTGVSRGRLEARLLRRSCVAAPAPRLVVVQGIAKGERGELAVQAMTEVGVDEIVPWAASRSVARWRGERGDRARQHWVDAARQATKQSRRAFLPGVARAHSSRQVAALLSSASLALVLHEEATRPLAGVPISDPSSPVVVVVGPEGGIAPEEIALFVAAGGMVVRLGDAVLRTSTAGVAALSVLNARLGRW